MSVILGGAFGRHSAAQPVEKTDSGAPPASWSDPRVIAELKKSCAFDPDKLKGEERKQWLGSDFGEGSRSIMSCYTGIEQSCVYDPCFESDQRDCRPRCAKTCHDCSDTCGKTCESCKAACQKGPAGAACLSACATTCATCHETCVRTRDRCHTGTCTEEYKQCHKKLRADWKRKNCRAVCNQYFACQNPCIKKHDKKGDAYEACTKPCEPKDKKGCNLMFCGGAYGMGIDLEAKED